MWPVPPHFYVCLEPNPPLVTLHNPLSDAEPAVSHHNLALTVDRLYHLQHCCCCFSEPPKLRLKNKLPICPPQPILPFDELYSPHNRLAVVPIGNRVIFVAKQVRLVGDALISIRVKYHIAIK